MTSTYRVARVVGEFEPNRGGVARTVSTLSRLLTKFGFETEIFSLGPAKSDNGLAVRELPRSPRGAARLWRELVRGRYDIIHTHVYASLIPATAMPGEALASAARALTTHFHAVGHRGAAARALFDKSVGWAALRFADQIQVDTVVERDTLAKAFGISPGRVEIVPPPLPPFLADLAPRPPKAPGDPFRLLFVGRLDPQKGLGTILDALRLLEADSKKRYELTVVGRDWMGMRLAYERQARGLVRGHVRFLGATPDDELLRLYDESDALVLASRYEAFGIVLAEAMSRGVPVIATRVGGIPELVRAGENGLLVPHGDTEALASAVRQLAHDHSLAASLGAAGPASVAAYHPLKIAAMEATSYGRLLATAR